MGSVVIDMSMSLDGYIAAPNDNPGAGARRGRDEAPQLGVRRPVRVRALLRRPDRGDRRRDHGPPHVRQLDRQLGRQGPAGRRPVLRRHPYARSRARTRSSRSSPTGSRAALAKAREAAGEKRIGLMGANIDQQFLAAGLVDEIRIHLVDVLLGGGRRLFDVLPERVELEQDRAQPGRRRHAPRVPRPAVARMAEHAVVVAGGGPTGLMLAGELALAGVDVAIVERRASQDLAGSRAGGLHSRTIEVLDQRGIADRFLSEGQVAQVAGFGGTRWTSATFPPGTPTGSGCGRTTSSASWPAGSTSWRCRSIADVR